VFVEVGDCDIGTFSREQDRNSPANSGIATRDECHHVAKLFRSAIGGRLIHWREPKVRFLARLLKVLSREFWRRISTHSSLHRAGLPRGSNFGLNFAIDRTLNCPFPSRRPFSLLLECADLPSGFAHLLPAGLEAAVI
jgi:hypothetical protein